MRLQGIVVPAVIPDVEIGPRRSPEQLKVVIAVKGALLGKLSGLLYPIGG